MIQIDMDMPKGCNSCFLVDSCKISSPLLIEPRPEKCPLHEFNQPEIIRCKDCKKCITKMVEKGNRMGNPKEEAWFCYGAFVGQRVKQDWFCANGERRTD